MAKNSKGYGRDAKIKECLCGHQLVPYSSGLCRKCYHSNWMNNWYEETRELRKPDHWRARNLWVLYKMTPEDYDKMFIEQKGVCKICSKPAKSKRLNVDHNHSTGMVRALLCGPCNTILSHVEHSSNFSIKALQYLKEHP